MNLNVAIVSADFKDSDYVNSSDCPLARAVRRTLKLNEEDEVGVDCVEVIVDRIGEGREVFRNGVFNVITYQTVKLMMEKDPNYVHTVTLTK